MAIEYSVQLFRSPDRDKPSDEIFDYDYQEIRRIAYAKTPAGGYSLILQQTWGNGAPIFEKGIVYRESVRGRPAVIFEFPNRQLRILNKDGSFGRYVKKEW